MKDLEERIDKIEENLKIVADNLNGLIKMVSTLRTNTDADVNGTRQSVANITPTTFTKTAYVGDTKIVFDNIPTGNLTVYFDDSYRIERDNRTNRLTLTFEPLKKATDITISIL